MKHDPDEIVLAAVKYWLEEGIKVLLDSRFTRAEAVAFTKLRHKAITKETERLIKEGYPEDIALKQACGFHANSRP